MKDGTDEIIEDILNLCKENNVFVIHSCSRRKLGLIKLLSNFKFKSFCKKV